MGSQRVGHDWMIELNWCDFNLLLYWVRLCIFFMFKGYSFSIKCYSTLSFKKKNSFKPFVECLYTLGQLAISLTWNYFSVLLFFSGFVYYFCFVYIQKFNSYFLKMYPNFNYSVKAFRSDQISRSVVSDSLRPHESEHARPPCPSPTPGVHWHSRPSSQWCHPAISSSVVPFSSCPQSLPASEALVIIKKALSVPKL